MRSRRRSIAQGSFAPIVVVPRVTTLKLGACAHRPVRRANGTARAPPFGHPNDAHSSAAPVSARSARNGMNGTIGRFRHPDHSLNLIQERNEAFRIACGKGVTMINDGFAAIIHAEYRRHEPLVAVMQQTPMPRRPRGFGAHHVRVPLLRGAANARAWATGRAARHRAIGSRRSSEQFTCTQQCFYSKENSVQNAYRYEHLSNLDEQECAYRRRHEQQSREAGRASGSPSWSHSSPSSASAEIGTRQGSK